LVQTDSKVNTRWSPGLKFLLNGHFKHFFAVLNAHTAFYLVVPKYLRIRKELKLKLKEDTIVGIYPKSIIKRHFIQKKSSFSEL
jgi:hypothetical protein